MQISLPQEGQIASKKSLTKWVTLVVFWNMSQQLRIIAFY